MAAVVIFAPAHATLAMAAPNTHGGVKLLEYVTGLESGSLAAVVLVDLPPDPSSLIPEWARTLTTGAQHSVALLDVIVVRGGRWWSYLCGDQHCCPVQGQPLPGRRAVAGPMRGRHESTDAGVDYG